MGGGEEGAVPPDPALPRCNVLEAHVVGRRVGGKARRRAKKDRGMVQPPPTPPPLPQHKVQRLGNDVKIRECWGSEPKAKKEFLRCLRCRKVFLL